MLYPSFGGAFGGVYAFDKNGIGYVVTSKSQAYINGKKYNYNDYVTWKSKFKEMAGVHGWLEVIIDGKTYVCDPSGARKGLNAYMVQYGQKGTYRYKNYQRYN